MGAVENIIIDNLPIWTSTIQSKSSAGRGISSKRNLYGIKKLRELILDLAVRGLLVPQDPNDEPAIDAIKIIKPTVEKIIKETIKNKITIPKPINFSEFVELPNSPNKIIPNEIINNIKINFFKEL